MIRLEIKGSVGVGKTTILSHILHCLRKSGYDVSVEGQEEPGELECLPPYFQLGQKVVLVEVDTSEELRVRRSIWPFFVVLFCLMAVFSVLFLPMELAIKVLTAFVVAMMIAAFFSGLRR